MSFSCQGIAKRYGTAIVVNDLSIDAEDGEITAIVGKNGTGKSTLVNIATGIVAPDAGRCFVDKRDTTGMTLSELRGLGVYRTFQSTRLAERLSVFDNVRIARRQWERASVLLSFVNCADKNENSSIKGALEEVGLVGREDAIVKNLSLGQKKLLAIACCGISRAKTAFLDEPVTGIEERERRRVANVLFRLRSSGCAVVVVEHDLKFVNEIADCVYTLESGIARRIY